MILVEQQNSSITSTILMFSLIFIIFYFFMIRPQIKKQKNEKIFQKKLKKGNYIVTNFGVHGKIIDIKENFCILETILGKIKLEKNTISRDLTKLRYGEKKYKEYENDEDNKEKKIKNKKKI